MSTQTRSWFPALLSPILLLVVGLGLAAGSSHATTYYVSSSGGDDDNLGTSDLSPFETIARVNTLDLQPGDIVRFKCGDVWRAEQLLITDAGTSGAPITFSSYPPDCANKPELSGARPISGWSLHSGSIYVTDLDTGANAGLFPLGINQLFASGQRLPLGRWPNLSTGQGGYAWVDSQPAGTQLGDSALPAADWSGAVIRIKTERWLLVNREVVSSSGPILTLNEAVSCRGGTCAGWGYFVHNHLATLDEDGEWYHDAATNRVYLYHAGGAPSGITGSVVLDEDTRFYGGVMIGAGAAYVEIDNLVISRWFNHGIAGAGSMRDDVYHHITVRDCVISDVDAAGVKLNTWIWDADNGRDGLRGGHSMLFTGNLIDGANHFGITGYMASSTFEHNQISNIGMIANLNSSGLGCGITGASCTENGDGIRIRRYLVEDSGHHNTVRYNEIERTGYNGIDIFGPYTTVEYNHIVEPCYSKGDCGGVRSFGDTSIAASEVHDITLRSNIIVDSIGNVDGVKADYRQLFGMGLYIDNYSADVDAIDNTVINSTITGILFQRSTGSITGNTMYDCASGSMYSGHVGLAGSATEISSMSGNVLYGLAESAWTLALDGGSLLASDYNSYFHPYVDKQITSGGWAGRKTLAEWQAWSGLDAHSTGNWFTIEPGTPPLSMVLYNPTASAASHDLGDRRYRDLEQTILAGSVVLQPFTSIVLIDDGPANAIFNDGFESGDTSAWSTVIGG